MASTTNSTILHSMSILSPWLSFALDLSQRVDAVKDENLKLKSENQVEIAAL